MSESNQSKKWLVISALVTVTVIAICASIVAVAAMKFQQMKEEALRQTNQAPPAVTADVPTPVDTTPETVSDSVSDTRVDVLPPETTTTIENRATNVSVLEESIVVHWSEGNSMETPCLAKFYGTTEFCFNPYNGLTFDEDERPISGNIQVFMKGDDCPDMGECLSMMGPIECSIFYSNLTWLSDELTHAPAYNDGIPGVPEDIPINYWSNDVQNLQLYFSEDCRVTSIQR